MIATVTLNPSLDKTVTVENLVLDETNRWTGLRRDPGGKGINVSRVIHELGGDTIAFGFIGGLDGQILRQLLREQGVPFSFTRIKEPIRSNFIITILEHHRQTRLDAPGPLIAENEMQRLTAKIARCKPKPEYMVFAGSVPPGVPLDIYCHLIQQANSQGIITVLDSAGIWLAEGIKACPTIIKPNVHEAEMLLGMKLSEEKAVIKAVALFAARGIKIAAISRGDKGMIISGMGKMLKVIAPKVEVKSTVGAGDATVAALLFQLSRGSTLEVAARWAVAAGTATVLTQGTQLCRRRDVERLLSEVEVKKLS